MTFKRGDVAWTYDMTTGEVRPVIVLKVQEADDEFTMHAVLWGTKKVIRFMLFDSAEAAEGIDPMLYDEKQNATK